MSIQMDIAAHTLPGHDRLRALTREAGIDAATVALHQHVRQMHEAYIERVDATAVRRVTLPPILIAPAAFYRERPRFGGDGRMVAQALCPLGIEAELIATASTGSVTRNAAMIARALAHRPEAVVLVSLSKGGADVRVALEMHPELAGKIHAWINLCGLLRGTPLSASLLGTSWWKRGLLRGYLAYTRADAGLVGELSDAPGSLLGGPLRLPVGLRMITLAGFPLRAQLSDNARQRHRRMEALGPNDGSMLLRDAVDVPGDVYPVWGADHFMGTPEVGPLLQRVLCDLEGRA